MLEVVQHQEGLLPLEVGAQGISCALALVFPQAQRPRGGRNHERRVPKRRQGDEGHAVREAVLGPTSRGHGQARLAHPAGEREKPGLRATKEEPPYLFQLSLPAHERGRRRWKCGNEGPLDGRRDLGGGGPPPGNRGTWGCWLVLREAKGVRERPHGV